MKNCSTTGIIKRLMAGELKKSEYYLLFVHGTMEDRCYVQRKYYNEHNIKPISIAIVDVNSVLMTL